MFKKLHNNQGFTLIELFTAMIILALTSASLYIMFEAGITLMEEQEHRRIAYELAQKRMQAFQFLSDYHNPGFGRDVFKEGTIEGEELIDEGLEGEEDESSIIAHYTVKVIKSTVGDYAQVSVKYEWRERSGAEYNVLLKDIYPLED